MTVNIKDSNLRDIIVVKELYGSDTSPRGVRCLCPLFCTWSFHWHTLFFTVFILDLLYRE